MEVAKAVWLHGASGPATGSSVLRKRVVAMTASNLTPAQCSRCLGGRPSRNGKVGLLPVVSFRKLFWAKLVVVVFQLMPVALRPIPAPHLNCWSVPIRFLISEWWGKTPQGIAPLAQTVQQGSGYSSRHSGGPHPR